MTQQLYGVELNVQYSGSLHRHTYCIYFDSKESYEEWLKWYDDNQNTLMCIQKKGKAYFNSRGILQIGKTRKKRTQ